MSKGKWVMVCALSGLLLAGTSAMAGITYYAAQPDSTEANWSNPDIWSPYTGDVPGADDAICVTGARTIVVDGNQYIKQVYPGYGWGDNYGWMRMDDPAASLTVTVSMYVAGTWDDGSVLGEFIQNAGTVTIATNLDIKTKAGTTVNSDYPGGTAWGRYTLNDGSLTVNGRIECGVPGKGMFVQNGGTANITWLMVGYGNNASLGADTDIAYYNLNAGTLNVSSQISLAVMGSSRGVFYMGNADTTGTINGAGHLWCRHATTATTDSVGIFQGWGNVNLTGVLHNNDKVIADGFGAAEDRDLNMSKFSSVVDDEYAATVGHGWYANNRARLILPALTVAAGSSTVNWGESVSDATLDLVNSVAMAFTDVNGGKVSVALNAKDRSDIGLADQNVIGVWAFDGSAFDFGSGSASLTFKYDAAAATTLGLTEANLKAYAKVAGNWTEVTATIDTATHQLTIDNQTAFTAIAIGEIVAQQVPGDANGDGKVDVSDLGILAANYGMTSGATLSQGDFNGDGAVDVSDLGILAANYGTGTQAGADFNADYAKVFGAASEENAAEDTTSSACSSLGLSLIAGLAMLGLMLVKLED